MINDPEAFKRALIKALVPIAFAKVDMRNVTAKDKIRALELTAKLCGIDKEELDTARQEAAIRVRAMLWKRVQEEIDRQRLEYEDTSVVDEQILAYKGPEAVADEREEPDPI